VAGLNRLFNPQVGNIKSVLYVSSGHIERNRLPALEMNDGRINAVLAHNHADVLFWAVALLASCHKKEET
jgi:hypothetical protein